MAPTNMGFSTTVDQVHHIMLRIPDAIFVTGQVSLEMRAFVNSPVAIASAGFDNFAISAEFDCNAAGTTTVGGASGRSVNIEPKKSIMPDCKTTEQTFGADQTCSMGYFGAEHINVIEANDSNVKFRLSGHSFPGVTLTDVKIWFLDPKKTFTDEINHYCWSGMESADKDGLFQQEFIAKCEDGFATVSLSGGEDGSKFKQWIDVEDPLCAGDDSADFNPQKRCFWKFQVPCSCGGRRDLAAAPVPDEQMDDCSRKSLIEDVHPVQVDSCITTPSKDTIRIVSQDKGTVTFSVSQKWKGSDSKETLGWVATDYINADGDLVCERKSNLSYGLADTYTAHCTDGIAIVDLYSFDTKSGLFGQEDGSGLVVPLACKASGDEKKQCHFRYVLKCEASLCDREANAYGMKKAEPARRLGGKN